MTDTEKRAEGRNQNIRLRKEGSQREGLVAVRSVTLTGPPGFVKIKYCSFRLVDGCQMRSLAVPDFKPKWRNWQTRMVQVHVPATVWGFESLLRHQVLKSSDLARRFRKSAT